MKVDEVKDFIVNMQSDDELIIEVSFERKHPAVSYWPQISYEVKKQIADMLTEFVVVEVDKNDIVGYQAIGVIDGEIECIDKQTIVGNENVEGKLLESASLDVAKIDYYKVEINSNGEKLHLYRQFQKLKRLRKGVFLQAIDHELKVLDPNFIGLDDTVDILEWKGELLVFNHISLERIFGYRDVFEEKTKKAMQELRRKEILENMDQFENDCMRDSRILKRFTDIMSKNRLPLFFDNISKVQDIVEILGLNIEFNDDGKLVYSEKGQLFHITNLMSDAYFKSLLAERMGLVKLEGNLEE